MYQKIIKKSCVKKNQKVCVKKYKKSVLKKAEI